MLSDEAVEFISNEMKINMQSIYEKFNEDQIRDCRKELEEAISIFVQLVLDQIRSGEVHETNLLAGSPARIAINDYSPDFSCCISSEEARKVLDSLRHAFCHFADGGLHQLFTHQENESWHPRIVLDEELEPNDINTLPENIELYRGTSIDELASEKYGQSWSTNKKAAYDFAFINYAQQPWFDASRRVVLKAKILRDRVYFSNQSNEECEVVVNACKLSDVQEYK